MGRWLVPELTRLGRDVVAIVRRAGERRTEYLEWVASHGGASRARVTLDRGRPRRSGLGLDDAAAAGSSAARATCSMRRASCSSG